MFKKFRAKSKPVIFLRTWVRFFVRQHRTEITARVADYLDSKKLSMDQWLKAVKDGHHGDIMYLYVLCLMNGKHACVHLKNNKIWCTLCAVPLNHEELLSRCNIHLVYLGFGIFQELKQQPPLELTIQIVRPVLGTITSDDPTALNISVTRNVTGTTDDQVMPKREVMEDSQKSTIPVPGTTSAPAGSKPKTTAAAGSVAQLPKVKHELQETSIS